MHDGVQYDPIQGQGQCHEPLKVGKSAIFNGYLLPYLQWRLANDHGISRSVRCEESTVSPVWG